MALRLHNYQEAAVTHVYEHSYTLVAAAMGAGKTVIALTAAQELILEGVVDRVLWIAPARVRDLVVTQEAEKWAMGLDVAVANGDALQRKRCFLGRKEVVVISYEAIQWLQENSHLLDGSRWIQENSHLLDGSRWMLVLDESTRLKNARSKRYKAMKKLLDRFEVRIAMTGTPVTQGPEDLFSQVYLLDKGRAFGESFDLFQRKYFNPVDEYRWSPAKGSVEAIAKKVAPFTFSLAGYELPDISYIDMPIQLPPAAAEMYAALEHDYVLDTDAGEVEVGSDGVLSNKLRQIADGFIYAEDGTQWLHDAKLDALQELIDTREPLLVVYTYQAQLERMRGLWPAPELGGGVSKRKAEQAVDNWNAGKLKLLYLHPASAGHGLNLQAGGATVVFASLPWSLEQYQQTIARVHRQGQTRPVRVFNVFCANTRADPAVSAALVRKESVQAAVNRVLTNGQ